MPATETGSYIDSLDTDTRQLVGSFLNDDGLARVKRLAESPFRTFNLSEPRMDLPSLRDAIAKYEHSGHFESSSAEKQWGVFKVNAGSILGQVYLAQKETKAMQVFPNLELYYGAQTVAKNGDYRVDPGTLRALDGTPLVYPDLIAVSQSYDVKFYDFMRVIPHRNESFTTRVKKLAESTNHSWLRALTEDTLMQLGLPDFEMPENEEIEFFIVTAQKGSEQFRPQVVAQSAGLKATYDAKLSTGIDLSAFSRFVIKKLVE